MDQYFVVSSEGKEYGPVDLQGLVEWVRQGRVLRTTLIRKGTAEPVAAETVSELAFAFAPAPPVNFAPQAGAAALPSEFRSWQFIGLAWDLVKPHWLQLGLIFLIVAAIAASGLGTCVFFVIGGAIYVGISRAVLGLIDGKAPDVGMMFDGFDRLGQAFLAMLVTKILIGLGTLLCIVPGIILFIMWMFVYFVMAETKLDFWPAMQASAKLAEGYWWELFCLLLACLIVLLLGLLVCLVGIFIAEPVVVTAIGLTYRFLQAKKGVQAAA